MITFFGSSAAAEIPAHDGKWSFVMGGYAVPSSQITTYACRGFTFLTDQNRHVVAFRPINAPQYNHHAIVHICQANSYFDQHETAQLCSYHPTGAVPGTNPAAARRLTPRRGRRSCSGLIYSWAWAWATSSFRCRGLPCGSRRDHQHHPGDPLRQPCADRQRR